MVNPSLSMTQTEPRPRARNFSELPGRPPSTRYQGSKRRLLPWIESHLRPLEFHSATDLLCGSSSVAYLLKMMGKSVIANDVLRANFVTARALVENASTTLTRGQIDRLVDGPRTSSRPPSPVIATAYDGIFFLAHENEWIDDYVARLSMFGDGQRAEHRRALALHALFQACLMKRPFNLFHRNNLHLRTADVKRTFGNKKTWETPFEDLVRRQLDEAHRAVFDNGERNIATQHDAFDVEVTTDLVYVDPPYLRARAAPFRYADAYHFLEGLTDYEGWAARIDRSKKHLPYQSPPSALDDPKSGADALAALMDRFCDVRHVVVSHRGDGTPSAEALSKILRAQKRLVSTFELPTKFALAKEAAREVLIVASKKLTTTSPRRSR